MSKQSQDSTRRSVLRSGIQITSGLALSGSVAAESPDDVVVESGSINSPVGHHPGSSLTQSTMPQEGQPDDKQTLQWLDVMDTKFKVRAGTPEQVVADTQHFWTLYRVPDEIPGSNLTMYVVWHWSAAEPNNEWWTDKTAIKRVKQSFSLKNSQDKLTSMSPDERIDRNGEWVRVSGGVEIGDYGFDIGGDVYVKDGTFGFLVDGTDLGPAGGFAADLNCNGWLKETATIHSTGVIRTENSNIDDWSDIGVDANAHVWADPT